MATFSIITIVSIIFIVIIIIIIIIIIVIIVIIVFIIIISTMNIIVIIGIGQKARDETFAVRNTVKNLLSGTEKFISYPPLLVIVSSRVRIC